MTVNLRSLLLQILYRDSNGFPIQPGHKTTPNGPTKHLRGRRRWARDGDVQVCTACRPEGCLPSPFAQAQTRRQTSSVEEGEERQRACGGHGDDERRCLSPCINPDPNAHSFRSVSTQDGQHSDIRDEAYCGRRRDRGGAPTWKRMPSFHSPSACRGGNLLRLDEVHQCEELGECGCACCCG